MNYITKTMYIRTILFCMMLGMGVTKAATYNWRDGSSSGFFVSTNWVDHSTGQSLSVINPGEEINQDLYIGEGSYIGSDREIRGLINMGSGKITFKKAMLRTDYVTPTGILSSAELLLDSSIVLVGMVDVPNVILKGKSELHFFEPEQALSEKTKIDLQGEEAWLFFLTNRPSEVKAKYLTNILVNGVGAIDGGNVRILPYYGGAVVVPQKSSTKALFIYSGENQTGKEQYFRVGCQMGENLCFDRNIGKSFKLRRGYMAVIAKQSNGRGGKSYIADDSDLMVNIHPNGVDDTIRFVKVVPWKWMCKKGVMGDYDDFAENWYYDGDTKETKYIDKQHVPMRITKSWPSLSSLIGNLDYTHLLGFEKPDSPDIPSQSPFYPEEAISVWPLLEETGLILGSPAPTNSRTGHEWLDVFMDKAAKSKSRVDYICLHNFEKMDPDYFVNTWCKRWYDKYKLPIWVTQYNYGDRTNTSDEDYNDVTKREMHFKNFQRCIELLEEAPFVERYAVCPFPLESLQPKDSIYSLFEEAPSILSRAGIWYREWESNPERGTPILYRKKIIDARALENSRLESDAYDRRGFRLLSGNMADGGSGIRISEEEGILFNFAQIGEMSGNDGDASERFTFNKVRENEYRINANHNCLSLAVRNDSVLVTPNEEVDEQVWSVIEIPGSACVALKNKATGKFLFSAAGANSIGSILKVMTINDISDHKAAYWMMSSVLSCGCKPEIENLFQVDVSPLSGEAPLSVKMSGHLLSLDGLPAYYRWDIQDENNHVVGTRYLDTYTFKSPGRYTIDVRCRDYVCVFNTVSFTVEVEKSQGINANEAGRFEVSPNPVGETLHLLGLSGGERVLIYNLQGIIAFDIINDGRPILLSSLLSGIYLVKIENYAPVKLIKR